MAADETAAWGLVQKGLAVKKTSPREKLYLNAVAALFKDAGAGPKAARDEGYRDAMAAALDVIAAQYDALTDKKTAADTPELQARHVRGRTIYAIPSRVVYGYFDMLTRDAVETGDWDAATKIPLLVPSRDFVAVKLQSETMAAAAHMNAAVAKLAAEKLVLLAQEPGQHPFAQQIITMQAKEAEALAAKAAGNVDEAIAKMKEAVAIEDSIDSLSQPPYPIIPANELFGTLLMELNRPADAKERFLQALKRTPGRPKAIYGIARAAQATGDKATAHQRYQP
jgi:tetratricopeptide (TPR) repeat protein